MKGTVLAINSGSSSVKFASFDIAPGVPPQRVVHGEVEGIGSAPRLRCGVARVHYSSHTGVRTEEVRHNPRMGCPALDNALL